MCVCVCVVIGNPQLSRKKYIFGRYVILGSNSGMNSVTTANISVLIYW